MMASSVAYPDLHIDVIGQGYQLVATWSGTSVQSPVFDVVLGEPDASRSELRAIASAAQADGQDYSLLSASIRNAVGLPIPNAPVTLSVVGGGTALSQATGMTDDAGNFDTQLRATTIGTKAVTLTVGSIALQTSVEFFTNSCTPKLPWREMVGEGGTQALKVADLDGNATDDIIVLHSPPSNGAYTSILAIRSKGDGRSFAPQEARVTGEARSIGVGDVTSDGIADIVTVASRRSYLGNVSSFLVVLPGDGAGRFGPERAIELTPTGFVEGSDSIVIRDVNRDGKNDLLWVMRQSQAQQKDLVLLTGNGDGTFGSPSVLYFSSQFINFRVSDLNNDGKVDLFIGDGGIFTLLGNGNGTFQPAVLVPVFESFSQSPLVLADVNGDNFPDVVGAQVWTGRGNGSFIRRSTQMITPPFAVRDMNGDGKLDAVGFYNPNQSGIGFQMWRGDGTGLFPQSGYSEALAPSFQLAVALNWDGDNRPDIAVGGEGVTIIMNDGAGGLITPNAVVANLRNLLVPPRDFTGDGVADVIGQDATNGVVLFTGTATGGVSTSRRYVSRGIVNYTTTPATSADFTGDGKLDLFVRNELAVNNGTGTLLPQPEQAIGDGFYLQGDFNADGKIDLAWQGGQGNPIDSRLRLAINTGNGVFASLGEIVPSNATTTKFVVFDMNNDGASDVAVATAAATLPFGWQYQIWVNQGDGTFAQPIVSALLDTPQYDPPSRIITGDFDGDTWSDLVVIGKTFTFVKNLGNGQFAAPSSPGLPITNLAPDFYSWQAIDFDLDGKLDIVDASCNLYFWHGFGNGAFRRPRVFTVARNTGCDSSGFSDRNGDNRGDMLTKYNVFGINTFASAIQSCAMESTN